MGLTARNIVINSGVTISSVNGAVTLKANQGGSPISGNFKGIRLDGAIIDSANGQITLSGRGGNSGTTQIGIELLTGSLVGANTTSTVSLNGTGGLGGGFDSGVSVNGNSKVTSNGGRVNVTGTTQSGGGLGNNIGVVVSTGGQIVAGGLGLTSVTGSGGATASTDNYGVYVFGAGVLSSSGGDLEVYALTGSPVAPAARFFLNAVVSTGGTGRLSLHCDTLDMDNSVTVKSGTLGTGNVEISVYTSGTKVDIGGFDISSSPKTLGLTDAELDRVFAGTVIIGADGSGTYPGAAPSRITVSSAIQHANDANFVVVTAQDIAVNANWTSTNGDLTFRANQQTSPTSGAFIGIEVNAATIASTTGDISFNGRGGNASTGQDGVRITGGAVVGSGTTGTITIQGTGGAGSGSQNVGVLINSGTVTSGGGNNVVIGTGGGGTTDNFGVWITGTGQINPGGSATVLVTGTGGTGSGASHYGVYLSSTSAKITSSGGSVSVIGQGGSASAIDLVGVDVNDGSISAEGAGTLTVQGIAGLGGSGSLAVNVHGSGQVSTKGTGSVTVIADSLAIQSTATIKAGASGNSTVTIRPYTAGTNINIGGADVLSGSKTLGITDAELDRVTAAKIIIGSDSSMSYPGVTTGTVSVSAAIQHSGDADFSVATARDIIFSSGARGKEMQQI